MFSRPGIFNKTLLLIALGMANNASAEEATPPPAPAGERAAPIGRSQDTAQALERTLPKSEQQTLTAGNEQFLALWKPANTAQPQGTIVLIPGDGESADWPNTISPLRQKLPDEGWQTLSLTLPDPQNQAPLPRNANGATSAPADADASTAEGASPTPVEGVTGTAPTPETQAEIGSGEPAQAGKAPSDAKALQDAYAEGVMARLAAGIDFALQRGSKQVILLGHGTGAYWAARYLAEREPSELHHLIIIDGKAPVNSGSNLDAIVPKLKVATGDFYHNQSSIAQASAQQRRQAAKREQSSDYTQVALKTIPGDPSDEQEQLYRRVRGWLSTHIAAGGGEQPAP
ncbi:alpha/beta hydrolase family protein [Pseudomonas luteola]